jgi:hypothetical protein
VLSNLLWILAAVGALFWIVLPAGILVMAVVCRRQSPPEPEGMWPCRAYDRADPSAEPCWVPVGMEYCPRHDGFGERTLPSP